MWKTLWISKPFISSWWIKSIQCSGKAGSPCGELTSPSPCCCSEIRIVDVCVCVGEWILEMRSGLITLVGGRSCHWQLVLRSYKPKMMHISLSMRSECVCTSRESWPGPGCLHLLPCVGQHVVALGFIDQITTRL